MIRLSSALVLLLSVVPALASDPAVATVDLSAPLEWFTINDTGVLLAYAGERLEMIDVLPAEPGPVKNLVLPGLDRHASVFEVPATGLLVATDLPGAAPDDPRRSMAIDTLGGRILWSGPSLGRMLWVELFLRRGIAVLRTEGGDHDVSAVDLATGEVLWQRDEIKLLWSERDYLGLLTDAFLIVDPSSGKTLRRTPIDVGKGDRFYPPMGDAAFVLRHGREFRGTVYPPYEGPSKRDGPEEITLEETWRFRAASPMIKRCFKIGTCRVLFPREDRMFVLSGVRYELLDLLTGKVLWNRKRGMLSTTDIALSPSGSLAALATAKGLEVVDLESGKLSGPVPYPKKLAGSKVSKTVNFIDDDVAMTVFPDRKGEPRGLTAFSCRRGKPLWTLELPRSARYSLTPKERSRLLGRVALALVATAVSTANPTSIGGASYSMIFIPNVNVRQRPATIFSGSRTGEGGSYLERHFARAVERYRRLAPLLAERRRQTRYFVAGPRGEYEILRIGLRDGSLSTARRYVASLVHGIYPDAGFQLAVSLEGNKQRLRLLSLAEDPG